MVGNRVLANFLEIYCALATVLLYHRCNVNRLSVVGKIEGGKSVAG